jgi:hypothetical protein
MNPYKIFDRVKTSGKNAVGKPGATTRFNGRVKYIACQLATTSGGKTCDKDNCLHQIQDYVFVIWPTMTKTMSYHYSELDYEPGYAPIPNPVLPDAKDLKTAPTTAKDIAMDKIKDNVSNVLKLPDRSYYFGNAKHRTYVEKKPLTNEELTPDFWRKYTGIDWIAPNEKDTQ